MKGEAKRKGNCRAGSALIDHLSVPHAMIRRGKTGEGGEGRRERERGRESG